MPIVFNNQTGKTEDLTPEAAHEGVSSGTHSIPMVTKDGEFTAVAPKDLPGALQQGYRQPEETEVQSMLDYTKHSTPEAQARAGLRSFANAATLGLFDVAYPRLTGMDPEQYRENAEKDDAANPGTAVAGKLAGLLAPGTITSKATEGFGKLVSSQIGTRAAKALQLHGNAFSNQALRIGAREAAQVALLQTGDEVAKQFTMEPEKSVGQSLLDIGLAGLTGAAFGVGVSAGNKFVLQPLVKASKETTIAKTLSALKSRAEGVDLTTDVDEIAAKAGLEVSPGIKAALSSNEALRQQAEKLAKTSTSAGAGFRQSVDEFKTTIKDKLLSSIGKSEKDIGSEVSRSELGKSLQDSASKIISEGKKTVDDLYAPINPILKRSFLPENFSRKVTQDLDKYGDELNLFVKASTGERNMVNQISLELGELKTFDELKSYISKTYKDLSRKGQNDLADIFYKAVKENEDLAMKEVIDIAAPQFTSQYQAAVASSKQLRQRLNNLGQAVGIKRFSDAEDLLEKIADPMKSEQILKSLTSERRAELFSVIQKDFPELADSVRKAHLDQIKLPLKNGELNLTKLVKDIDDMTPETKEFLFGAQGSEQIKALGSLFNRLGKSKETAALDSILSKIPGGIGSILGGVGFGGVSGAIAGYAVGAASKEASDAFRLSMLKYLASGAEASGGGFNAMFQAAHSAYRGAAKMEKGISSLFKPAVTAAEAFAAPSSKSLGLLDKAVMAAQVEPEKLADISGDLGDYLPEHAAHLAATSARAMSYLASLRPDTGKQGPLEPERVPSDVEIARYNRALSIVEQPLMILKHVKDGTITPQDITTISTVYPGLYEQLKQNIMDKMVDSLHKGTSIPYETRLGLSLFLGQPLERSIQPSSIMSNQSIHIPQQLQKQMAPQSGVPKKSNLPNLNATPQQLREQKKGK
jgi:hypothetical protein